MHTSSYLSELIIIFLVTTPVVVILQKLRQPAIIGYLLAGILLGPSTFGLVQNLQHIEMMAEVGVMLLLFSIGLEFSLAHLKELKRYIFIGGTLQVGLSIICVFIITRVFGFSIQESLILGFLVSLSSTAIVLKMLFDRGEMDSVQGEVAVGLLLLQDLCVVPMMLIMHSLGRAEVLFWHGILIALLKAALVVSILVISMRYLLPKLLILIARMRNRELFSLCIVLICLGTAWATQKAGLSLALGAFLAGLILAESEYCHYIAAEILPLRNLLSSLFFISIGMLLNVHFVRAFFPAVISMMGVVVLGKGIIIAIIVYMLMRSVRIAILSGLYLAQIGEFSFILAWEGKDLGLLSESNYQGFLAFSVLSMMVTPFLFRIAPGLSFWGQKIFKENKMIHKKHRDKEPRKGHVIIVGYGLNGRNLAQVLTQTHIPFVVVGLNPDALLEARNNDFYAIYGDASDPDILEEAGVRNAHVIVIAISDPIASRRIVRLGRSLNEKIHILVRTRYVAEIDALYRIGVNQVVPEEFETSVEIFSRVLREYRVPRNVIDVQVDLIRQDRYGMLRGLSLSGEVLAKLPEILKQTTVETFLLLDHSPLVGKLLTEYYDLKKSGAVLMAVVRDGKGIPEKNLPSEFRFTMGDILILVGSHAQLDMARLHLSGDKNKDSEDIH